MPRQPLRGISGNSNCKGGIAGRFELTPYWGSHTVGRASGGQCIKIITADLEMHPATTRGILKNGSMNTIQAQSSYW